MSQCSARLSSHSDQVDLSRPTAERGILGGPGCTKNIDLKRLEGHPGITDLCFSSPGEWRRDLTRLESRRKSGLFSPRGGEGTSWCHPAVTSPSPAGRGWGSKGTGMASLWREGTGLCPALPPPSQEGQEAAEMWAPHLSAGWKGESVDTQAHSRNPSPAPPAGVPPSPTGRPRASTAARPHDQCYFSL